MKSSKSLKTIAAEKKPFQWSNIFGIDRKKKSVGLIYHPLESADKKRKRCASGECGEEEYGECLRLVATHGVIRFILIHSADEDYEDEDYRRKKKRSREEKLETMDEKLKTIENLIIEDTAKYYENHDGMWRTAYHRWIVSDDDITGSLSASEARALRNRIAERLSTAYSLEKMRKAIARLKQSMAMEKNLERNLLHGAQVESEDEKKKAKRVAVKKEKAEFNNQE